MEAFIISCINNFGYFGIAFLIAIENIFPPIPSEVILTFGGFVTLSTNLTVVGVIISATIGAIIGAVFLYLIGRFFNPLRLEKLIDGKIGKLLRLKKSDIKKADNWFDTKGHLTVFFCRFIPIVRSLISIPAGMSEMPFTPFIILTTLGSLIWNSVLVYLGRMASVSWPKVVSVFDTYSKLGLIIIIILLFVSIIYFYCKRYYKNKKS